MSNSTASLSEDKKKTGSDSSEILLSVLQKLCEHHSIPFSREKALHGLPAEQRKLTVDLFPQSAANLGLKTKFVKIRPSEVPPMTYPFVVFLKNRGAGIVYASGNERDSVELGIMDQPREKISISQLDNQCAGTVIYATPENPESINGFSGSPDKTGHWLWSAVFRFWLTWAYMVLAALIINLLGLALPLFVMNVYDRVIPYSSFSTLWALVAGVGLALFFDFILRVMRSTLISNASKRVDMTVSARLFNQAMDTKMSERNSCSGDLANQIREFESVRDFFTSSGLLAIIDLIFIGIFLALLWWIVSELALVPMIAVPVVLLATLLFQYPLGKAVKESQSTNSNRHAILVETLNSIETVKSIRAEGVMQKRWESSVARNVRASASLGYWSALTVFFTTTVQQAVSVIMITWGVFLVTEGKITIGALIASNILAGRVLAPIGGIANTLTRMQQSFTALDGLNRFMELEKDNQPEKGKDGKTGAGEIEFRNVVFTYPGDTKPALNDVSLKIGHGERVAILGKVGSGKSSIGRLLAGLYENDQGVITLDDTDIRHYSSAQLRSRIGYSAQETDLFTGTLRDNILIANPETQNFEDAVRISGALGIAQSHPLGFEMPVGERGRAISGGQRQTIALARMLVGDHQILFLDEPTSQMDTMSENSLLTGFSKWLAKDKTLILSTHRTSMLKLVDRIILLDGGKIVADGPKQQVLKIISNGKQVTSKEGK